MREKKKIKKTQGDNNETKVIVSFPESISTHLVPANELKNYEIYQWLVIILLPIAASFWTAYFTVGFGNSYILWSACIFTAVSFLFIGMAVHSRRKIINGSISKEVSLDDLK